MLLDLHGTLIQKGSKKNLMRALRYSVAFLNERGYAFTFEDYLRSWKAQINKFVSNEELLEPSFEEWYCGLLGGLKLEDVDEVFVAGLNSYFMKGFEDSTKAFSNAGACLSALRKKNYLLALVSNSLAENTDIDLKRTGLAHYFDVVIVSSQIGRRKPHPLVFQRAVERLGISPREGIFVGDDFWEDIHGAKSAGLKTVLVTHAGYREAVPRRRRRTEETPDALVSDLGAVVRIVEQLS